MADYPRGIIDDAAGPPRAPREQSRLRRPRAGRTQIDAEQREQAAGAIALEGTATRHPLHR